MIDSTVAVKRHPNFHGHRRNTVLKNPWLINFESGKARTVGTSGTGKRLKKIAVQQIYARRFSSYPISKCTNYAVFVTCFIICCYQLGTFSRDYFSFPTTVYIRIKQKARNPVPAIVICNKNEFIRSTLCNISEQYCNKTRMFDIKSDLTTEIDKEMVKNYSRFTHTRTMFKSCYVRTESNLQINVTDYCHINARWIFNGAHSCWALNSKWEDTILSHVNETTIIGLDLLIDYHPDEYTVNDIPSPYRGYLYFLSPDDVPSNAVHSFTLYGNKGYYIKFTKSTIERMQSPYETMCRDYHGEWENGGRTGVYSEQTCYYHCLWKLLRKRCGCIPEGIPYPIEFSPCSRLKESNCSEVLNYGKVFCHGNCAVGCKTSIFNAATYGMHDRCGNETRLWLDIRGTIQFSYEHRAQFKPVELFGYVGGFSGIWLGLSVPKIFELLQELFIRMKNKRKFAKDNLRIRTYSLH